MKASRAASFITSAILTAALLATGPPAHAEPLDGWESALAQATTRRVNVLVLGDSISEGNGTAVPVVESWPSVLGAMMPRAGGGGRGGPGYVPAAYGWGSANSAWRLTGSPTINTNGSSYRGLGRRSITLTAGQTARYTWYGNNFATYFTKTATSGVMGVRVDGGLVKGIVTSSADEVNSARYVPAALSRGWHTLTISHISGGPIHLEGGAFWDGDINSGVTVWNGSHSGINTDFLIGSENEERWAAMIANIRPDLVIIALGTNDASAEELEGIYSPDIYGQRVTALMDLVRDSSTADPSFVLLQQPGSPGVDADYWQRHMDALADVAEAEDAHLVDLRSVMPQGPGPLYTDSLHPNAAGARLYALEAAQRLEVLG